MSLIPTSIAQGQTKRLISVQSQIQATVSTINRDTGRLSLSSHSRVPPLLKRPTRPASPAHPPRSTQPSIQSTRTFHSSLSRRLQVEAKAPNQSKHDPPKQEKSFSYRLAASYCGKQYKFKPASHYFTFDPTQSKQWLGGKPIELGFLRDKRIPSGQDSCFITAIGTTGAAAFGVADGVGGWIDQGIDSADFAHGICRHITDICRRFKSPSKSSWSGESPKDLLNSAYEEVCNDDKITGGGSTACLGIADKSGNLKVANLGDSGFIHLRLSKVHHVSDHQTHAFNTPYQLSLVPRKMKEQILAFGGQGPISDMPKHAGVTNHSLSHGDVVMFATDGVWDNLSSQDLLGLVSEKMIATGAWVENHDKGLQVGAGLKRLVQEPPSDDRAKSLQVMIATGIVEKAKAASMDERRDSPFAKAVRGHYPSERYFGGKVDDICVVVGIAIDDGLV